MIYLQKTYGTAQDDPTSEFTIYGENEVLALIRLARCITAYMDEGYTVHRDDSSRYAYSVRRLGSPGDHFTLSLIGMSDDNDDTRPVVVLVKGNTHGDIH